MARTGAVIFERRSEVATKNTLVFFGSPRKNGETAGLVGMLADRLDSQVEIINAYECAVSACVDCRRCKTQSGCMIDDDMTELYQKIAQADNVVIASPLYFTEITGRLLDIFSRLQTCYCAKAFRNEQPLSAKKGGIILVGGGSGKPDKALDTAKIVLRTMNVCGEIPHVVFHDTDVSHACDDKKVQEGISALAEYFNRD